mgnify:CR=1 FL=1
MSDAKKAILDKIRSAVDDGLKLRVVTVVGDITATKAPGDRNTKFLVQGTQKEGGADPAIETRIDLIDGDVQTAIHEKFVADDKFKPVLQMHMDRETLAQQRLAKNLELVKQLYAFVKDELAEDDPKKPPVADPTPA